ncbi:MAG: hypothetical protein EHM64_00150 [Ignavibacteriae bacterium]|nr:MAG: hypothetical protein EHM64_00150 [Ignavibacteriota bacterium]
MIVTLTEVKSILQITDTTYDTLIRLNIPIAEQTICDYCRSDFLDAVSDAVNNSDITFISSDNSVNMTGIESEKFIANDTIRIYNSFRNDGVYTIDSVETNKFILNGINTIQDEDEGNSVIIVKVKYPVPLKIIASQMIKCNLAKISPLFKSQTIDDYTYTIDTDMLNGYPKNLMIALNQYRCVYKETLEHKLIWW